MENVVILSTKEAWKEVKFQDLQSDMLSNASKIAANNDNSELSRVALVEQMREFRKNTPKDIRDGVSYIIKRFQQEIDHLTIRCKTTEEVFHSLFNKLSELPDPSLALAEAEILMVREQRTRDLEMDNRKMRETIQSLEREKIANDSILSDYSILKRKLADFERDFESKSTSQLTQRLSDLTQSYENREKLLTAAKEEAESRLSSAEQRAKTAQTSLEAVQNELSQIKLLRDDKESMKSGEFRFLQQENENLQKHLALINQELNLLKGKLASGQEGLMEDRSPELERFKSDLAEAIASLSNKDVIIAKLNDSLATMRQQSFDERAQTERQIGQLNTEIVSLRSSLASVQQDLMKKQDYDRIKHELSILSQMEFQSEDAHDSSKRSLEEKLLNQNRKLQSSLADLSSERESLKDQLHSVSTEKDALKSELEHKSMTLGKMENDLRVLTDRTMNPVLAVSALTTGDIYEQQQSTMPESPIASESERTRRESTASSVISWGATSPSFEPVNTLNHGTIGSSSASGCTLCRVMQAQRDRLRTLNQTLDQGNTDLRRQVYDLQCDLNTTRADNVKLYEKVRFLQSSYNNRPISSTSLQVEDDLTQRYSTTYETNYLNPFSQFNRRARQEYHARMQPHEKLMLSFSQLITGNSKLRLGAFIYLAAMHLIVFLSLYFMATQTVPDDCIARFNEHMKNEHEHPQT